MVDDGVKLNDPVPSPITTEKTYDEVTKLLQLTNEL